MFITLQLFTITNDILYLQNFLLVFAILSFIISLLLLLLTIRSTNLQHFAVQHCLLTTIWLVSLLCCMCSFTVMTAVDMQTRERRVRCWPVLILFIYFYCFFIFLLCSCNIALFIIVFALNNLLLLRYNFWRPRPLPHNHTAWQRRPHPRQQRPKFANRQRTKQTITTKA